MVERRDPARTGVVVGRAVGVVTGLATVAVVFFGREPAAARLLGVVGVREVAGAVTAVDALVTAGVRYGVCYVVGSLLGVVYGWADRHATAVLAGSALAVGVVDAAVSFQSPALALVCLLAWVGFVPTFLWAVPASDANRDGPLRLG